MFKGSQNEVQPEPVPYPGAQGVFIQWLVAQPQGAANFYMRRVIIEEGGLVPEHQHPEEHEVYILTGSGRVTEEDSTTQIGPGDFLFIPGGRKHKFTNTGPGQLSFICCINAVRK